RLGNPPGDPRGGRDPASDQSVLTLAGDGFEYELACALIEQHDRGGASGKDRPRDLHDRLQQRSVALACGDRARGNRRPELALVGHSGPMLEAVSCKTVFSWNGVR